MWDIMCDCISGGGARLGYRWYIIMEEGLEEGPEEAVDVWGSRNWMMDYSMFSSFQQPDHNSDGCPALHPCECVRVHATV